VIRFPGDDDLTIVQGDLWRFSDYGGPGYSVEDWYQSLDDEEQRIFDNLLKTNSKADTPKDWNGSKMLQGEAKPEAIWEWRFHPHGVQQRVLGIFGADRKHAIFLIGCNHKQKVYVPPDCIKLAIKRARQVRDGKVNLNGRPIKSNI
jgi:hypothetical protein